MWGSQFWLEAGLRMMKKMDNRLPYGRGSEPLLNRDRKGVGCSSFSNILNTCVEMSLDTARTSACGTSYQISRRLSWMLRDSLCVPS